jgi:hypothetical protein
MLIKKKELQATLLPDIFPRLQVLFRNYCAAQLDFGALKRVGVEEF